MKEDLTWGPWCKDLCATLIKEIPDLEGAYLKEMKSRGNRTTGALITFENLLKPYIVRLLSSGEGTEALTKLFELLEAMCGDEDARVREVAVKSVFKRLEWDEELRELMDPYLGPLSKQAVRDLTRSRNLWNRKVNARLIEEFPELESAYREDLKSWRGEEPGPHTIYGEFFNPYIRDLLESGDQPDALKRVFNLVEAMCGDEDVRVQEVAVVTVLAAFEWNSELREFLEPHLGPRTKEALSEMALWRGEVLDW